MSDFERKFYEAGMMDASESQTIVFAAYSNRYGQLCRELNVQIADKRGNSVRAYDRGVAYEINRQTMLMT